MNSSYANRQSSSEARLGDMRRRLEREAMLGGSGSD